MLEFDIEIGDHLAGELASRLMVLWPGLEVMASQGSVTFQLPVDERIDENLTKLETVLQKLEAARDLAPLILRTQNLAGPDHQPDTLRVGPFLIHHPELDVIPEPGRIDMILEAGPAFGTGQHPSTALVLSALAEYFNPPPGVPELTGIRVLDVGTGSGILSIAAARLGAASVLAIDPVIEAVKTARVNVERNQVSEIVEVMQITLDQVTARFDLILANLVTAVLLKTGQKLKSLLDPAGLMILAGFADKQMPQVMKVMTKLGLVCQKSFSSRGWSALMLVADRTWQ